MVCFRITGRQNSVPVHKPSLDTVKSKSFPDDIHCLIHFHLFLLNDPPKMVHRSTIPDEDVKRMIAESYDLVTDSPAKRIYEAVKRIPKGHVATYGQIAEMAGDKKMARAVGNALHRNPDPDHIPCFRVVNSKGELSGAFAFGGSGAQAKLLLEDGVEVVDGRVDLRRYGINVKGYL